MPWTCAFHTASLRLCCLTPALLSCHCRVMYRVFPARPLHIPSCMYAPSGESSPSLQSCHVCLNASSIRRQPSSTRFPVTGVAEAHWPLTRLRFSSNSRTCNPQTLVRRSSSTYISWTASLCLGVPQFPKLERLISHPTVCSEFLFFLL